MSSANLLIPNLSVSELFRAILSNPHVNLKRPTPSVAPGPPVPNYPYEENIDPKAVDFKVRFQQEFSLVSMKYKRPLNPNQNLLKIDFKLLTKEILNL